MRHKKKGNHLSRTASHKKALMRNMAAQVIEHKEIKTTVAKAKELRGYVERLITYAKKGTLHHRRLAFKLLQNKGIVHHLFEDVGPTFEGRNGGYTRIIRLSLRRLGDNGQLVLLQLVGKEEMLKTEAKAAVKVEEVVEAEEVEETDDSSESGEEQR